MDIDSSKSIVGLQFNKPIQICKEYQLYLLFFCFEVCDIAGPGFDFLSYVRHSEAAENVACYYSSLDKGTQFRSCHQNILLGHCGYTQPAILSQPYYSSHGLSVQIYINAFDYPFYAAKTVPPWCLVANPLQNLPIGFKVGYNGNITK